MLIKKISLNEWLNLLWEIFEPCAASDYYDDEAKVDVVKGNKFAIESYGHEEKVHRKGGLLHHHRYYCFDSQ